MKKKIFTGIAVLAIVAIAAFNVNMNLNVNNGEVSSLSLANVVALAGENVGTKKCIQNHTNVYNKEMCSTYPVKYRIQSGLNYTFKKDPNGSLSQGKKGFEGTITNECAVWPSPTTTNVTAPTVNC